MQMPIAYSWRGLVQLLLLRTELQSMEDRSHAMGLLGAPAPAPPPRAGHRRSLLHRIPSRDPSMLSMLYGSTISLSCCTMKLCKYTKSGSMTPLVHCRFGRVRSYLRHVFTPSDACKLPFFGDTSPHGKQPFTNHEINECHEAGDGAAAAARPTRPPPPTRRLCVHAGCRATRASNLLLVHFMSWDA